MRIALSTRQRLGLVLTDRVWRRVGIVCGLAVARRVAVSANDGIGRARNGVRGGLCVGVDLAFASYWFAVFVRCVDGTFDAKYSTRVGERRVDGNGLQQLLSDDLGAADRTPDSERKQRQLPLGRSELERGFIGLGVRFAVDGAYSERGAFAVGNGRHG